MSEEPFKFASPWQEFFNEIDEQLTEPSAIVCVGGFVVTQIHGFSRNTADVDHVESPRELAERLQTIAGKGSRLHKKYKIYLDYVGGIITMPLNFDERVTEVVLPFRNFRILVPEVYDLILSKLERNSPKDYQDVRFLAEKYNLSFSALKKRFDEELDFISNRERHINTLNFLWKDWFRE